MKNFNFVREYKACLLASLFIILFFVLRYYYAGFTGEENRYASVAWQMYQEHNWLVPRLGYGIYPDKPPLTYWLTILGWYINPSWQWPLIIPGLFTLGIFFLTQKLAKLLFPTKVLLQQLAPVILLGMPYFVMHYGLVRFDMQLTFFNLLACYALLSFNTKPRIKFILFALANTLGVLAKGPVIYLFTIPEVIAFALAYQFASKQFFIRYFLAILFSLVLCLLWVVPVLMQMGMAYAHHLIIEQVFMRVSSGHVGGSKPFWHYLPTLGLMLFPWILFKSFWKSKAFELKKSSKFLLISIVGPIVILSIVVSKQERYLLPLAPLLAIYMAACFADLLSVRLNKNMILSKSVYLVGSLLLVFGVVVFFAIQYDLHLNLLYKYYFPRELGLVIALISLSFFVLSKISFYKQIAAVAVLIFIIIATLQLGYLFAVAKARNLLPIAQQLKTLQSKNIPIISTDIIVNEMQYMGKLSKPIPSMSLESFQNGEWKSQNPEGWVLLTTKIDKFKLESSGCYTQTYSRLKREMQLCPVALLD